MTITGMPAISVVARFLLQYLETVDIRHIQVKQQEIGRRARSMLSVAPARW